MEQTLLSLIPEQGVCDLLDIGTGSGRLLELLASRAQRAIGIDLSYNMLRIARAKIEQAGLRHCQVRHGDMYTLPLPSRSFDVVILDHVLHHADNPSVAIEEACRVIRTHGLLVILDFALHEHLDLKTVYHHRHLGFANESITRWCSRSSLICRPPISIPSASLVVMIWSGVKSHPFEASC